MSWQQKLLADEIVIIDGATGTELQRRGVPMDDVAWSGTAVLSHPEEVTQLHREYIDAGADVIIANTFGATRQMLEPAGFGDRVAAVNRGAIELAIEAREQSSGSHVAIAGSLSAMPPRFQRDAYAGPNQEIESYREAVRLMTAAGCDLIALEMMEDITHSQRAMEAAVESDLPVWLGISCRQTDQGELVGFGQHDISLDEILDALIPIGPSVVNIMHTNIELIPDAIAAVQNRWSGPIGVYPESGHFENPNWNFVDVITPEELVKHAESWVQSGVRLLGGCCGTGPAHIEALVQAVASGRLSVSQHPTAR